MSGRRLFGVETEYAVTAIDRSGSVWSTPRLNEELLRRARRRLMHLPGTGNCGLFLSNGSRLYVDYGDHPEIGSPECLDPWDAVRYSKAGDRIMVQLAEDVQRDHPEIAEVVIRKGNVDYSGQLSTWGAHESYCHRSDPEALRRRLVPHLVSRVAYTGAGGFNPFSGGLEFMLSPRAQHIICVISNDSTENRGITHTRDEPLAAHGYLRQHVLCGESLGSDLAAWLRIGTTAVVVAMIEANVRCGDEVALEQPLDALALFARDTDCRRTVSTAAGPLTAVQIQRRYLNRAVEHLDAPWMPAWARDVCTRWDRVLSCVERGPKACSKSLDWAIKLAVFRDRARRRGFEWDLLPVWTQIAEGLAPRRTGWTPFDSVDVAEFQPRDARRAAAESVRPLVREHGLQLADLSRFLALRQELFEVDMRFGQVGPRSVFEALDASGVLDHGVPGVDRIDDAIEHPPEQGRARLRGEAIRQATKTARRYSCCWEYVIDHQTEAYLDLRDPFGERAIWKMPQPPAAPSRRPPDRRTTPAPLSRREDSPLPRVEQVEQDVSMVLRLLARIRGTRQQAS